MHLVRSAQCCPEILRRPRGSGLCWSPRRALLTPPLTLYWGMHNSFFFFCLPDPAAGFVFLDENAIMRHHGTCTFEFEFGWVWRQFLEPQMCLDCNFDLSIRSRRSKLPLEPIPMTQNMRGAQIQTHCGKHFRHCVVNKRTVLYGKNGQKANISANPIKS